MQTSKNISLQKFKNAQFHEVQDVVAIEEPLEIRLSHWRGKQLLTQSVSITMRTPSHDTELALGFLYTEGILSAKNQVEKVSQVSENEIVIETKKECSLNLAKLERHFYTSSSCGVCGKSSIDAVRTVHNAPNFSPSLSFSHEILPHLSEKVRTAQATFQSTGGLHASALFDLQGDLQALYEDIGRHNALDKLIGAHFLQDLLPLSTSLLFLSGRASFELIQKAAMAEIPIIVALGAPSSLAVQLAKEFDLTLIGFLKTDSFNVYCGGNRVV